MPSSDTDPILFDLEERAHAAGRTHERGLAVLLRRGETGPITTGAAVAAVVAAAEPAPIRQGRPRQGQ